LTLKKLFDDSADKENALLQLKTEIHIILIKKDEMNA